MKLKIEERVYLQKYEIAFILEELRSIPVSVYDEIFTRNRMFSISGAEDGFKFNCLFENPESIEWLMEQDWIVDYDEYAKTSNQEVISAIGELNRKYSTDMDKFNAKDEHYRKTHYEETVEKFRKYDHLFASFDYLLAEKNGKLKFTFPDECHNEKNLSSNPLEWLFSRNAQ